MSVTRLHAYTPTRLPFHTMKKGMSLEALANEVYRQRKINTDLLVNTANISIIGDQPTLCIRDSETDFFQSATITDWTHQQIAESLGIPVAYYRRMMGKSMPLLNTNVNHWLQTQPTDRMVRLQGAAHEIKARAWLSPRFRRLDNWDLAETVLPIINDHCMEVVSCNVSESFMHIKALFFDLAADLAEVGDTVRAGIAIRNSEIGKSRLVIAPLMERLVCKNGMVFDDYATKQVHLGKRIERDDPIAELYSDETINADDRAFWLKVRDTVKAALNPERFVALVEQVKATQEVGIPVRHLEGVRNITSKIRINNDDQESILDRLINHEGLSQFGLAQAISAEANIIDEYDSASQLEVEAGRLLTMTPNQFHAKLTEK